MDSFESVSEGLSPVAIKNKEFSKTLVGYSPREVVEFLDVVARRWEQLQKQERTLLARIESLDEEVKRWKDRESAIEEMRRKAESDTKALQDQASQEAARFLKNVQERADQIREKTEAWLERVIAEVEETEKRRQSVLAHLKDTLDKHYQLLDGQTPGALLEGQLQKLRETGQLPV